MKDDEGEVIYLRRTALLQGAGTLLVSGQYHCGEHLKKMQALLDEIEGGTGWNARDGITIIQRLWEHYQTTQSSSHQSEEHPSRQEERLTRRT
jgi:hypothetical protein